MSYVQPVVDFLNADATLMAILTGGCWNFSDAGRNGLNRLQVPGAYDPISGFLKPVGIVAEMDAELDGEQVSPNTGRFSQQASIYIRIMDHGDNGYGTIQQASDRIKTLLNCKPQIIANAWQLILKKTLEDRREGLLKDACYYQQLYIVHGWFTS
jgi:hypothetical protein